jgi:hypothetical protein
MKEKFITSKGSIELYNNIIFIKNRKTNFYETGFARIAWAFLPAVCLILVIIFSDSPFQLFIRIVLFGILTVERIPTLYQLIIKTSYSNRIGLEQIASVEAIDDKNGLETVVLINLKNKRTRSVPFRKLEKQYELFFNALSVPTIITVSEEVSS